MDCQDFIDNFVTATEAPGGVERLRRLVLDLAVQGQLVPQDPSEESVSDALHTIQRDKGATLAASFRGGASIPREPTPAERVEPLPAGWCWARIDETGEYVNGLAFNSKDWIPSGTPIIRIQNLTNPSVPFNHAAGAFPDDRMVHDGDILVSWSATLDVFRWDRGEAVVNQHIFKVIPDNRVVATPFLFHLLRHSVRAMAESEAAHGLVMKHINRGPFLSFVVRLPPLAEQERIATKVNELMSLCDELEGSQRHRSRTAARFRASALKVLAEAQTPTEVRRAWQRVDANWPAFTGQPDGISELRKAVLRLAVSGMLTSGGREGRTVALGDVVSLQNGYAFKSEWYTQEGVSLVRCQNISHGDLRWDDRRAIDDNRSAEFARFNLKVGDIVLALDRPIISTGLKVAKIKEDDLPCLLLQRVARLAPDEDEIDPDFLWLWLHSDAFLGSVDPGRSNGVPHISTREVASVAIWLPPLHIQRETVRRTELLLDACDSLRRSMSHAISISTSAVAAMTSVAKMTNDFV